MDIFISSFFFYLIDQAATGVFEHDWKWTTKFIWAKWNADIEVLTEKPRKKKPGDLTENQSGPKKACNVLRFTVSDGRIWLWCLCLINLKGTWGIFKPGPYAYILKV